MKRCKIHPKYKGGGQKPRTDCLTCYEMWFLFKPRISEDKSDDNVPSLVYIPDPVMLL